MILGCGAPLLPSIGLVDAMRVSPDIGPDYAVQSGHTDAAGPPVEQWFPSLRSAMTTGRARAFQHARLWVNDPDCLLARPGVPRREEWARYVTRCNGIVASGDRMDALDAWGVDTTRRVLRPSLPQPVDWDPFAPLLSPSQRR